MHIIKIIRIYRWIFNFYFSISNNIFLKWVIFYTIHNIIYLMTVSLVQWRAATGIFNCRSLEMHKNLTCNEFKVFVTVLECWFLCYHYLENFFFSLLTVLYMFLLLRSHKDIELNSGPRMIITSLFAIGILIV